MRPNGRHLLLGGLCGVALVVLVQPAQAIPSAGQRMGRCEPVGIEGTFPVQGAPQQLRVLVTHFAGEAEESQSLGGLISEGLSSTLPLYLKQLPESLSGS